MPMSSEIRTFVIPDDAPDPARVEIAGFLRSVMVDRIDTAYTDGAWRVLVLYQDTRRKEESEQIESAIRGCLASWRDQLAARTGQAREDILTEALLTDIAHYAPTTERELAAIASSHPEIDVTAYGAAIVAEVKQMLDALID